MDKTIYIFPKNKFQDIRVGIREYKGNNLIDIRTWTMTQGSDDRVPTAKGITINLNLLSELKLAIKKLEEEIANGL